jgi:translocation and assembly module TamB
MVKRGIKIFAGLLATALLLLLVASAWLLGSRGGAHWLFTRASQSSGVEVTARVDGSVWGGLALYDLQVDWPEGRARLDQLQLVWRPLRLVNQQLQIEQLTLGNLQIESYATDPAATTQPPAARRPDWPQLPDWLANSTIHVDTFTAAKISIANASKPPLILDDVRLSLALSAGRLQGKDLHLGLPCGRLDGTVMVDFARRQLTADLLWHGTAIVADWDTVRTRVGLDEQFSGALQVDILAGSTARLKLKADAALTSAGATLTQLAIARSNAADRVTGSLQLDWSEPLQLALDLQLEHLNLLAEAGWPTDLTGAVQARLTATGYSGTLDLESARPHLEQGRLAATVNGDWQSLQLSGLNAAWLDGELTGELTLNWTTGFRLAGALRGQELNPAALIPGMDGQLQLAIDGSMQMTAQGELSADWDARLDHSLLQKRPVAGRIAGHWAKNDLQIDVLDLHGDGLQLTGEGRLRDRLDLRLRVDNLARLGQGWQGALMATGWLARPEENWIGGASGALHGVEIGTLQATDGTFNIDYPGAQATNRLALDLQTLTLPQGQLDQASVSASGQLDGHDINLRLAWPTGHLTGRLAGGWQKSAWSGQLLELDGNEALIGDWSMIAPTQLQVAPDRVFIEALQLIGTDAGEFNLAADLQPEPLNGTVQADWQELPLRLLNPWLGGPTLSGSASGNLDLGLHPKGAMELVADLAAAPTVHWQDHKLTFAPSQVRIDWGTSGLLVEGQVALARGGRIVLDLQSAQSGRPSHPEQGDLTLFWEDIDLRQFASWLPPRVSAEGLWLGDISAHWQDGATPLFKGKSRIESGALQWQQADGLLSLPLRQTEMTGSWQSGWAEGDLHVTLVEHGEINGQFRLPLGVDDPTAPLQAVLGFDLNELGLLTMLMPGLANESRGNLQGDLRLAGNRQQPQLFGHLTLRDAGADIPALGLKLRETEVDVSFDQSTLTLERLQLASGEGRLAGSGSLEWLDWQPKTWSLILKGETFELVNLPEITLTASPDLQVDWTKERLRIRGETLIPTLQINQLPKSGAIEPSSDVILSEVSTETTAKTGEQLDVAVRVKLGDHVVIKAKGLDAQLGGDVLVTTDRHGAFVGQGEIHVIRGHYAAYGLKLPITRGRALFGGGAVQEPVLDVLAERTIDEVKAGVQVTGTPRKPLVTLVSTPSMPDTEILSYIVLGRPLGAPGAQNSGLMLGASALLSQGESVALQEKIKGQIGIDVLEVQSSGGNGVEGSMVAVGKYLTPELYLSFGRSLFTPSSVAKLRYQLGEHWEVESQFGTVSGADLSYRIEFR